MLCQALLHVDLHFYRTGNPKRRRETATVPGERRDRQFAMDKVYKLALFRARETGGKMRQTAHERSIHRHEQRHTLYIV